MSKVSIEDLRYDKEILEKELKKSLNDMMRRYDVRAISINIETMQSMVGSEVINVDLEVKI